MAAERVAGSWPAASSAATASDRRQREPTAAARLERLTSVGLSLVALAGEIPRRKTGAKLWKLVLSFFFLVFLCYLLFSRLG